MEVDRLKRDYPDVEVKWAPFLLDPSIPAEGRTREPRTKPGDPPTQLEERATDQGLTFTRGRTFTPNSHLALEAAQFAQEQGQDGNFHELLFKEHFTNNGNLGDIETLVRLGGEAGVDEAELREALETRRHEQEVDHGIAWAQAIGVTGVPTFIFNEKYAIVGAQEYPAFQRLMERFGHPPPPGTEPPPADMQITFPEDG